MLGYDYGLLLCILKNRNREKYKECIAALEKKVLDVRDDFGMWSEYYENDKQTNVRCRAWESAFNIEALIT